MMIAHSQYPVRILWDDGETTTFRSEADHMRRELVCPHGNDQGFHHDHLMWWGCTRCMSIAIWQVPS